MQSEQKKDNKKAWTTIAQRCIDEYHDAIHSITGFAPSYLLYGKQLDTVPIEIREQNDFTKDRKLAHVNSLRNHEQNKERLKPKGKVHEFNIGDLVFIENGNNREKLDEVRIGPFEIVEKRSNSVFSVKVNNNKTRNSRLYHRNKMIPFSRVMSE